MVARTAERIMTPITQAASEAIWSRACSAADASTSGRGSQTSSSIDDEGSAVVLLSDETCGTEAAPLVSHNAFKLAFCGGASGAFAKTCTAPLARLTILYQVKALPMSASAGQQLGIIPALRHIAATEGLRSLWKGNLVTIMHRIPYSATNFFIYETTLRSLQGRLPNDAMRAWAAGATSGLVACTVAYPLDLIRTRVAADTSRAGGPQSYRPLSAALRRILSDRGVCGLYKGLGATLVQVVPALAFNFCFYDTFKRLVMHHQLRAVARHQQGQLGQGVQLPTGGQLNGGQQGLAAEVTRVAPQGPCKETAGEAQTCGEAQHQENQQQQMRVCCIETQLASGSLGSCSGGSNSSGRGSNICGGSGSCGGGDDGTSRIRHPSAAAAGTAAGAGVVGCAAAAGPGGAAAVVAAPSPLTSALCACAAGLCTSSLTFPLDVVRRRLQVYDRGALASLKYGDVVRSLLAEGGLRAFYRGIGPECAKVLPGMAIAFTTYEALKRVTGVA